MAALAGDVPVIDGVDRTVMIAAETTCAAAIIFPLWHIGKLNVADRAFLRTATAVDTHVGIDGELPVGYHVAVEVGAYDVAERPRRQTEGQLSVANLQIGRAHV